MVAAQELEWDHLVISGDLTQLALAEEFALARQTLAPLLNRPERVSIVPGNHDYYVRESREGDGFRQFFGAFFGEEEIHTCRLNDDWHLIGWHCAHPTPWYSAAGWVRQQTLQATERYLQNLPPGVRCVLVNHYPVAFPDGHEPKSEHELLNLEQVQHWLSRQPQIQLYLHGHIHRNWEHLQHYPSHTLHVVNSASSTMEVPADHSCFHRITLAGDRIHVEPLRY